MEKENRQAYEKPAFTKLTKEQAKGKLLEHFKRGSREANEFLELIFPEAAAEYSEAKKESA